MWADQDCVRGGNCCCLRTEQQSLLRSQSEENSSGGSVVPPRRTCPCMRIIEAVFEITGEQLNNSSTTQHALDTRVDPV